MNLYFCRTGRDRQDKIWSPLISSYIQRTRPYTPIQEELFLTEERLWAALDRRTRSFYLVLLDQRGRHLSSSQFAEHLKSLQETGPQDIVFCIGPADGFSDSSRKRADLLLSFGAMTLPHQMAALVLAEQVYRAFTILAGHPYHSGH